MGEVAELSRHACGLPPPPRRLVHLGVGSFHRAHQAWYTHKANAGAAHPVGIHAFTGQRAEAALALHRQDGLYTLITRGPDRDSAEIVSSVCEASDGADRPTWLAAVADPEIATVTITVTEAGYARTAHGHSLDSPVVRRGIQLLKGDVAASSGSAMGRLVDGLRARMRGQVTGLTIISCDNLRNNGGVLRDSVIAIARAVDPHLEVWIDENVSFRSSMVDRITPAPTAELRAIAESLTGYRDGTPVVTEPFSEWIIEGSPSESFPAWESVGVAFTQALAPYEDRKLRLLNGAHSLLAYVGLDRGLTTVSEAMLDPVCADLLDEFWDEAVPTVELPGADLAHYVGQLRERFLNERIEHQLSQIAVNGDEKLAQRILPVVREVMADGGKFPRAARQVINAYARFSRESSDAYLARAAKDLVSDGGGG